MLIDVAMLGALRDALVAQLWLGGADLRIEVLSGAMPLSIDSPITDAVLVRFVVPLAQVSLGGAAISIPAGVEGAHEADGLAGWARFVDDSGHARLCMRCTTSAGPGVFVMSSLSIASGVPVRTLASHIVVGG